MAQKQETLALKSDSTEKYHVFNTKILVHVWMGRVYAIKPVIQRHCRASADNLVYTEEG